MKYYLIERSHFSASVTSERSHDQEKKHSNHDADVYHLWCGRLVHLVTRSCIKSRVQWRWIKNQINRAYFELSREVLVLGHTYIVCCTCPPRSNRSKDPFLLICLWPRIQFCRSSRGCWWNNPLKVHTTNYYRKLCVFIVTTFISSLYDPSASDTLQRTKQWLRLSPSELSHWIVPLQSPVFSHIVWL